MIAIAKSDMCEQIEICPAVIIIIIVTIVSSYNQELSMRCPVSPLTNKLIYSSKGHFANHMIKVMVPIEGTE